MESKKNAHRLNRIFRKPKTMVTSRSWYGDDEESRDQSGVSLGWLSAMTAGLSDEEKNRALTEQDPPSAMQEELAKRAARFGLVVGDAGNGSSAAVQKRAERFGTTESQPWVVDKATLESREARFNSGDRLEMSEAMQKRMARFGEATPAAPPQMELKISEADREAMERRQNRFAV